MRWPWRRRAREIELTEEIQAHLEMAVAQRIERGESPAVARDHALREFGNTTHVAEVTREMWGGASWDAFVRDIRYAARGLRRSPTFTAVAVATFALGIGANTAMFTVVNGALLKPLPFAQPDRLVFLTHWPAELGASSRSGLSDHTFVEIRATPWRAFALLASFSGSQMTLTGTGDAERLSTAVVSANLTTTLGVSAAIGRTFTAAEEQAGDDHVVLLSDTFWRERFGGARSVLGTSIVLDNVSYTVIGVMPPTFDFPHGAALWTPLVVRPDPNVFAIRPVIARLSAGTTMEAARRELESTLARLPSTKDEKPGTQITAVSPLADLLVARARPLLWIFSGAVSFVLLIACANVANLLLIRAATRGHEIGVRVALGAGRGRIVRQLVTESALVACIGGAAGLVLSMWGVRVILATAPAGRIPRGSEITVDWRVLGVTFGVALVAGLVCGIFPALASTRRDPREALSTSGRTVAGSHDRIRRVFVIAQLALAIVLATGAGLLLKSFSRMRAVDPGFRASGVVTFSASLPAAAFPNAVDVRTFDASVVDRLRQLPGVESASMVNWMPLGRAGLVHGGLQIEGVSTVPKGYDVDKLVIAPGYFGTMGIRLFAGRDFDSGDNHSSRPVTIVTRSVARKFWPPDGLGALGQRLTKDRGDDWNTIVGIVDDVAQQGVTYGRDVAQYFPLTQTETVPFINNVNFVLRTARTAQELTPSLRAIVHELNPVVALRNIRSMDDVVAASMADPRFETRLLAIFAALALLLAAVGTYGVLAYDVAARTHELGVRVALGAVSHDVVRVVVRRTLALVVPGLLLGLIGALAVTRVLQKSLFEVTPTDPATLVAVSGVLLLVALIAGLAPTRRAMRVDPMTALRSE
ncbi:MAG TPA: ABC transporter permease [Gemmatimonadaceae bacterium]|nr:ABC transporter permease [Gemmatimonadaceae bacterium]